MEVRVGLRWRLRQLLASAACQTVLVPHGKTFVAITKPLYPARERFVLMKGKPVGICAAGTLFGATAPNTEKRALCTLAFAISPQSRDRLHTRMTYLSQSLLGMDRMQKVFLTLVLLWPLAGHADLQAGKAAYARGDYATARRELQPLAAAGNASAQTSIGILYAEGFGVDKDEAEAIKWFRMAADQGDAKAQLNLGIMYMYSLIDGAQEPDKVRAYAWLNLAAAKSDADAAYLKDLLRSNRNMTDEQIVAAQRLSRELCARIPSCEN